MEINDAIDTIMAYHKLEKAVVRPPKPVAKFKKGDYVRLHNAQKRYWYKEMDAYDGEIAVITNVRHNSYETFYRFVVDGRDHISFLEQDCTLIDADVAKAEIAHKKANRPSLSASLIKAIGNQSTGVATFGIRFAYGADYYAVGDICHARLKWPHGQEDKKEMTEIRLWVEGYRRHGYAVEATKTHPGWYDKYLHHMLNDSPWASACITKDIAEAYRDGILMDVNKNVSVIVGAAIAIREGWEHSQRLRLYNELLDKGVNSNVAYLVSAYVGYKPSGKEFAITGIAQGHMVLHQSLEWKALRRFFREGYDPELKGIAKDTTQCQYFIFNTIVRSTSQDKYYGARVTNGSMEKVFDKVLDAQVEGEGFAKRTVIKQENVDRLVDFLTKELA